MIKAAFGYCALATVLSMYALIWGIYAEEPGSTTGAAYLSLCTHGFTAFGLGIKLSSSASRSTGDQ